jgi:hypothetical protein
LFSRDWKGRGRTRAGKRAGQRDGGTMERLSLVVCVHSLATGTHMSRDVTG